ncbi:MAG: riboflavin biosynthesis protein RibF [Tannerella sp.]|jgi:riboflavin kinase/FMN adenylyltransferase|nr:riboflavin biosynthesis protein RibF [Tannerella sp.]
MRVIYDIKDWKEKAVVAVVGFFDGVHPGHCFLIEEMRRIALERNLPTAVITFPVHPRMVLQSDYQPKLLNSFEEKLERLSQTGIDYTIVMDFTPSLAALTAREFIIEILSKQWRVRTLLIGYDHRFGRSRSDGFDEYVIYGRACGMEVFNATSYSKEGMAISSSVIRQLLQVGDVAGAARILGYFYRLKGHVADGYKVGRTIGFPTANIAIDEKYKVIPAAGSYAVWVILGGKRYKGMLYIGSRPTLEDGGEMSIEVNIFDFSGYIYNEPVTVEFIDFIRKDMKFDSLEELRTQMQEDKINAQLTTGDLFTSPYRK